MAIVRVPEACAVSAASGKPIERRARANKVEFMARKGPAPPRLLEKPEFVDIQATRLAVVILLIVVASRTCPPARAKEDQYGLEQRAQASVFQADPPVVRKLLSTGNEETGNRIRFEDRLRRALPASFAISDPPTPDPDQQQSRTQAFAQWQDDCLDECVQPFCINPCPCVYGQVDALFLMLEPRLARQPIVVDPNWHRLEHGGPAG